jgi:energy-coupling factor transporter ATP-binding protein EcfA2
MLKGVTLRNFKLHRSTEIQLAPLTLFIGPNNSGKSSIFQALTLLRQSAISNRGAILASPVPRQLTNENDPFLYPSDQQIDLGSFEDIVHAGQQEIDFQILGEVDDADPKYGGRRDVRIEVGFHNNRLAYHRGTISLEAALGARKLDWKWASGAVSFPQQQSNVDILGRPFMFSVVDYPQMLQAQEFSTPAQQDQALIAELSSLQNRIAQLPRSLLLSVHPIYPLRGLEESGYPVISYPEPSIDRMMLADRTLSLLNVLAYRNDLLDRVSEWLEDLIGIRVRTKLVPPKRVTVVCEPTNREHRRIGLFSNEGAGANQLPFILVPIALCPPHETVMLSEPEVHLHPKAQGGLASLLLTIVKAGQRQLVIETHSEHVLHILLHAVAKGEVRKEDVAIYYFEATGGSAQVRRVEVDDLGRVEGGLPGFFDQSLGELSDYLETLQKKN